MTLPDPPKPRPDGCAYECSSPPSTTTSSSHGNPGMVTALVVTASVLVFIPLVSLIYCLLRHRHRRRQQSLLAAEGVEVGGAATTAAAPDVEGGGEEEEVVHHAWHIRTVGLDEAAIESIALTRYRAGAGMLGAADCPVCLGEFQDGELLRLLPKCGHAFHVPCIDTWLRAHVNCPLCRADVVVLDPADAGHSDAGASADADASDEQASSNIETSDDQPQPGPGQDQNELRVQIDQHDQRISPEPLHRQPGWRFRRVASMDLTTVPAGEGEQSSKENQRNSDAACCKVSPVSGNLYHMKRSLSAGVRRPLLSRHCRTSSAMLPL